MDSGTGRSRKLRNDGGSSHLLGNRALNTGSRIMRQQTLLDQFPATTPKGGAGNECQGPLAVRAATLTVYPHCTRHAPRPTANQRGTMTLAILYRNSAVVPLCRMSFLPKIPQSMWQMGGGVPQDTRPGVPFLQSISWRRSSGKPLVSPRFRLHWFLPDDRPHERGAKRVRGPCATTIVRVASSWCCFLETTGGRADG